MLNWREMHWAKLKGGFKGKYGIFRQFNISFAHSVVFVWWRFSIWSEELLPIWWGGGNVFKSCPLFKVLSIFPSDQPRDQLFGHLMMITFYFQILIEIRLSQLNNVELEIKRKTSKARRYVGRKEKPPQVLFCSHFLLGLLSIFNCECWVGCSESGIMRNLLLRL